VTAARVLQVVLSLDTGGTERLVVELCTKLRRRVEMAVCCLDSPGALAQEVTDCGIEVVALHRDTGFRPTLGYRIAKLAERHRATIIHCHQYSPFVYGRIATLCHPHLKLVFTEHGRLSDGPPSLKRRMINPLLGWLPGSLYSVSSALRDSMIAEGFPTRRIAVIHNGVDPGAPPTTADRRTARRDLWIPEGTLVVGTVARLDRVKNLETLIDAFAGMRAVFPRSALVIIGDGEERSRLEAFARNSGVREAIRFYGNRADVRRLMPGFDVYVNSSISEGVSLTILEAMATGLPVVATAVGGTPEIVIDGITGVLVPARQPATLTAALVELCTSPDLRRVLGSAARQSVEAAFGIDRMVEQYAGVYEQLAG
jgi:glycosyltransferase involved in cell wall biosynthesis